MTTSLAPLWPWLGTRTRIGNDSSMITVHPGRTWLCVACEVMGSGSTCWVCGRPVPALLDARYGFDRGYTSAVMLVKLAEAQRHE